MRGFYALLMDKIHTLAGNARTGLDLLAKAEGPH